MSTAFLTQPGRSGPLGALMDETTRAADEFCRLIETIAPERYIWRRPGAKEGEASVQNICAHVVAAARRYADYIRKIRGLPHVENYLAEPETVAQTAQVRQRLVEALRYTEEALDGLYDAGDEAVAALRFNVRWGPVYDPEMLLEHGVCHLLRHRRQVERLSWP